MFYSQGQIRHVNLTSTKGRCATKCSCGMFPGVSALILSPASRQMCRQLHLGLTFVRTCSLHYHYISTKAHFLLLDHIAKSDSVQVIAHIYGPHIFSPVTHRSDTSFLLSSSSFTSTKVVPQRPAQACQQQIITLNKTKEAKDLEIQEDICEVLAKEAG